MLVDSVDLCLFVVTISLGNVKNGHILEHSSFYEKVGGVGG